MQAAVTDSGGNVITPAAYQDDATFRDYAILSMEARSVAGPEGAYVAYALKTAIDPVTGLSGVLDAACYGEEDGALYANGTAVVAPEVLIVILARAGDGTAGPDLIAATLASCSAKTVRPIGDRVTVESASITYFSIAGTLTVPEGVDADPLLAAATEACRAYAEAVRKIGTPIDVFDIGAAMKVGTNVSVNVTSPPASFDPGSKGSGYCHPDNITITSVVAPPTWRA